MDKIECHLDNIINGVALETDQPVDYTLAEQIEDLISKNVEPLVSSDYRPIVKKSVAYIVAVVLINEDDEVLMMQEAKSSCAGEWYLPAGRMEVGENIVDAAKRELLEETGLQFEPTTLLSVECSGGQWYRFTLTGDITGGELKTVAKADAESLQASWIKDIDQLSLRAFDIIPLIEKTRTYYKNKFNGMWHNPILPALCPHNCLLLRLVIIIRKRTNNRIHVLVSENQQAHLPVCEINPVKSIHTVLRRFIQYLFGPDLPSHKPHGVLSVEHNGDPPKEHDGLCLSILVSCKDALEDVPLNHGFTWLEVSREMGEDLLKRTEKNMTISLSVKR
ncbi:8-oxo-dGDP phosphatase NUDT18-like [Centruroides sculpturatus]|uniref:8-oxo-dGDP phosphatase NUDT18-like n=1 Tax=Centruroides sculpturatus TaxID=218467 RepID=UPI000C6DA979|nr:8-oxo-dGDP phosphatase NUDT18-like [Centruroides sculpturatus]